MVTQTYWVDQTTGSCISNRIPVDVTAGTPAVPTASAQSFCTASTVANLTATGTGILSWFNVATGGTALAPTTALATGTYFVSQTIGSCTSTRTSVAVTVGLAAAPTASAQSFCNSATFANLVATGTGILSWFDVATGGTALASTTALVTGTYFVQQTIGSCTSIRTSVVVTVNVVSTPNGVASQTFVQGATVANLIVNGTGTIMWFVSSANATSNTNALLASQLLLNGSTYFAVATDGNCRSNPFAVTVTVTLSATDFNSLHFVMYPNPAAEILNIETNFELQSVEIYNIQGRKVLTSYLNQVVVSALAEGFYTIRVKSVDGKVASKKLIVK